MKSFKYLYFISTIYLTFTLLTVCLIYKIVDIHGVTVSAATLLIPFWYITSDILTEVYGYKTARTITWCAILAEFIFIFSAYLMINLPSPPSLNTQTAYHEIFEPLPRVFIGSITAIFFGCFSNMYFLSKWKILTKGKYFWIRSIISSSIGELIFTVIVFSVEFIGKMPLNQIVELMTVSYIFKLIFLGIASGPATLAASFLKKAENINIYDHTTNYNPFKLTE